MVDNIRKLTTQVYYSQKLLSFSGQYHLIEIHTRFLTIENS